MATADSKLMVPARVLISLLFLILGVRKLLAWGGTVGYFGKLGLPAPELMLALVVAVEVLGGAALALGWKVKWAALALAVFTVIASLVAHNFWSVDAAQFSAQLTQFLKNMAIVGGLLLVAFTAVEPAGAKQAPANQPA